MGWSVLRLTTGALSGSAILSRRTPRGRCGRSILSPKRIVCGQNTSACRCSSARLCSAASAAATTHLHASSCGDCVTQADADAQAADGPVGLTSAANWVLRLRCDPLDQVARPTAAGG
jgi:hypothetical protein